MARAPRNCESCSSEYTPKNYRQRFCSKVCKGKFKYINRDVTTESQYRQISGNWQRYLSQLLYFAGRKRDLLTREDLLKILEEQDYVCKISGIPLTCKLEKGIKFWTNASVDRIEPGGPYTPENIQLVCRGLNSWRSDTPLNDFIEICRKVAEHNPREIGG